MSARIHWLASYPKSGNTWLRLVLSELARPAEAEFDINDIEGGTVASSRAWIDQVLGFPSSELTSDELASARAEVYRWSALQAEIGDVHKIHDACWRTSSGKWLPCAEASGPSIYLIRNPLDVALSYAHHSQWSVTKTIKAMADPLHTLSAAQQGFVTPQVEQRLQTWSDHVVSWVDNAEFDVLVVRYEDMKADPHAAFMAAARHVGYAPAEEHLADAIEKTRFDKLRALEARTAFKEKAAGPQEFFRKGAVGDWEENLSAQHVQQIIADHREVMERFGYCDSNGAPLRG